MKFAFIHAEKANYPVAFMCRHLEVSREARQAERVEDFHSRHVDP